MTSIRQPFCHLVYTQLIICHSYTHSLFPLPTSPKQTVGLTLQQFLNRFSRNVVPKPFHFKDSETDTNNTLDHHDQNNHKLPYCVTYGSNYSESKTLLSSRFILISLQRILFISPTQCCTLKVQHCRFTCSKLFSTQLTLSDVCVPTHLHIIALL